ncbi:polysaccharide biosynthesis C-terminal domain-containing protein [Polaribacter haliotis]|uniref:Polysaccharide biosynthesis C-terminal domain-containing protein n=1 Tax=Polaribacter haliotis TaxID=1888915 RepID=A0A7L8AKH2_9FLAO|nr:polysaccharide biosynthesis C-terminal domain-containing protein [Polaribacter haliotis]QOD62289.1 polysaccharide biosynthesis C-terminal domain-containing protein [Polaribacter haliotis]
MLIKKYIQNFLSRSGGHIFLATFFSRLFSFLASWFAIQFVPNKELGVVLFAYNIILFLIPFAGLGLHQSLIRYGALLKTAEEKNNLFSYVFKKGFLISICIVSVTIVFALLFPFQFNKTGIYLAFLSLVLIPDFIMQIIKIQFRLQHNNKLFSYVDIFHSTILVVFVLLLSFFYQENGYVIAIIIAPLITSLVFFKRLKINLSFKIKPTIINLSFWKYGFYSGLTSVVSNLLLVIDILLIGYLLKDPELVTSYKYIAIIPLSILFLPRMFMATDFVAFTEKISNKKYIFNYTKSYMALFTVVSLFFFSFFYFFAETTLSLIDESLIRYSSSFIILSFGVCGVLIFRGLFGNLLSSIGKIEINYYINSIAIIINIASNYYLIPIYGIKGAAITSAFLMWFTGIFSAIWFLYLYQKNYAN